MSPLLFWRLSLLMPPFVACVGFALFAAVSAALGTGPSPTFGNTVGAAIAVAGFGLVLGVWPAYAVWALVYVWVTRRQSARRFRAGALYAPLTFVPVCIAGWVFAAAIGGRAVVVDLAWLGTVAGLVLLAGYASLGVAFVLAALFRALGWLRPLPPPAPKPAG